MDGQAIIKWSRDFRSVYLKPLGNLFIRARITANLITVFSLMFGVTAYYFLFRDHFFFMVFVLLHLVADGLDGVVARLKGDTLFGDYFDHITDQTVSFLLLLKVYFYLHDYFVILVLILYLLTYSVYFFSKLKTPVFYTRTVIVIALIFMPLFPVNLFLTGLYLAIGVIVISSLLMQLSYFFSKVKRI